MDLFRGLGYFRQMGFSVILANFEAFDFGLLGEVMIVWARIYDEDGYL